MIYLHVIQVKNVVMDVMESELVGGRMIEWQDVDLWNRDGDVAKLEIRVTPLGQH